MVIDLPARKNTRLKNHDYSSYGLYFITICTYDKANLFGRVVGAIHESPVLPQPESPAASLYQSWAKKYADKSSCHVALNDFGVILQSIIEQLPVKYPELEIRNHIIMPNHIHMIIAICAKRAIHESPLRSRTLISTSIGYLKMNASRRINDLSERKLTIWQRSYYDHIVRDEDDYARIYRYIDDNPIKWIEDRYYNA